MSADTGIHKWIESADAWITDQGEAGDWSRRAILDPALAPLLSDVGGKSVLDLGCGEGRYARVLRERGAEVTGVDPVPQFVQRAQTLDPDSRYVQGRAEDLPFADASFDLVLSYLTLIDIADLASAATEMLRVLRTPGELVIATLSNMASTTPSWVKDEQGRKVHRTIDNYMEEFTLDLAWRGIRIRNYHRPLSYVLGLFLERGLVLTHLLEPLPDPADPHYTDERRVPTFQILRLVRQDRGQG